MADQLTRGRDWRKIEGLEGEEDGMGEFEGIILCLSLRFHRVTCSCIIELRKAVTLSWIFSQNEIFRGFSLYDNQSCDWCVQRTDA